MAESCMLHRSKTGEAVDRPESEGETFMPALAQNLTQSVATVRRKLLEMMDAIAETGMRHAHREISRAKSEPKGRGASTKRKTRGNDPSARH